jgi:hypothetical protein
MIMVDFVECIKGTLSIILHPLIDRIQILKKYGFKPPQKDSNSVSNQPVAPKPPIRKTGADAEYRTNQCLQTHRLEKQVRKESAVEFKRKESSVELKRKDSPKKKTKAEEAKIEEEVIKEEPPMELEFIIVNDDSAADVGAAIEERYQVIKKKAQEFYDVLFVNDQKFRTKKELIESGLRRQQNRVAFELVAKIANRRFSQVQGEDTAELDVGASQVLVDSWLTNK